MLFIMLTVDKCVENHQLKPSGDDKYVHTNFTIKLSFARLTFRNVSVNEIHCTVLAFRRWNSMLSYCCFYRSGRRLLPNKSTTINQYNYPFIMLIISTAQFETALVHKLYKSLHDPNIEYGVWNRLRVNTVLSYFLNGLNRTDEYSKQATH